MGSILGSGRSPGEGNGYPLQYSCLENPMDRGAWRAGVHRDPKELDGTEWLNNSRKGSGQNQEDREHSMNTWGMQESLAWKEGGSGGGQRKSRKTSSQKTYNSTLGARKSLWATCSVVTEDDRGKSWWELRVPDSEISESGCSGRWLGLWYPESGWGRGGHALGWLCPSCFQQTLTQNPSSFLVVRTALWAHSIPESRKGSMGMAPIPGRGHKRCGDSTAQSLPHHHHACAAYCPALLKPP